VVSDTRSAGEPRAYELAIFTRMLDLLSRVSEREETQKELASARDAALAASRAKSEFLATMSHEIRTPLNGVIGLSELLSRTELTPHQRRLAEGVDQAGRALLALVTDILDLSKVEAGRLDLELVDFDPRAIVEQSVGLLAGRAAAKHLELVVSSADQMPATVAGDPVRFGQVITNLVANAVKFTGAGEVWVRASGEGGTAVRVEVRDTGIGVAPEVRHRLFTAFSQADSSTTREYGGTGLGLAISERIVDAMGGEIGVDSEPGAGSTFWFTVPFAAPAAAPAGSLPQGAVTGLHVLVVDDNATNRFILAEQLEAWQAKVTVVASAEDALAGLDAAARANEPFDVALLDYLMPGTDGEELARAIRDDERYAAMRIALLSSSVEPTAEWLAAAGIDAFIGKPVLASRLFDSLADLTGRGLVAGLPAPLPSDAGEHPVRGRLLVVEDNPVNQLVAHGILTGLGYDVVISENGSEAVGAVADDPAGFDAVLMDCQMPVMDGFDATRALRAMEGRDRHVPIIAMTASATAEERERCREAGMDDFLSKPVAPDVLATTLARWLPAGVPPGTAYEPTREERDTPCRARVRALVEDDGLAPGLVRSIADRFATSSEATYDELVAGARAGDHAGTAERSHRIRGSALNLGLTDLAGHCLEVETATRAGRLPDDSGLVALGAALAAAVAELDDACARLPR
jgi:signal transduction histidine kinase/DNA-binding response OmpR family regulator/HPt (histidine-containing phosphotransfer) domain-containing protein